MEAAAHVNVTEAVKGVSYVVGQVEIQYSLFDGRINVICSFWQYDYEEGGSRPLLLAELSTDV